MTDYDFVCIGGGLGGLAAAIRAHALGLSPLIIEKSEFVGGVAAYSGGDIWVPLNHVAREESIADSREAALAYMAYVGGESVPFSPAVRNAYIDTVATAVEFYARSEGVDFHLGANSDAYYPHAPGSVAIGRSMDATVNGADLGPWGELLRPSPYFAPHLRAAELCQVGDTEPRMLVAEGELSRRQGMNYLTRGRGLAGAFLRAAVARQIPIWTNAEGKCLIQEDGRVRGVVVEQEGDARIVRASRGVLVATGGYGQARYASAMEGLPEFSEQAPPILHGDGISLAATTSAALVRAGFGYVTLGYESATDVHPGTETPLIHPILDSLSRPHIIAVNQDGVRYGDESVYVTFANCIGAYDSVRKRYANFPTYAIMDDEFRRSGYEFGWGRGDRWPEVELTSADTVGGLAAALGLPAASVESTVARFNGFCESGVDSDFHRGDLLSAQGRRADGLNPSLGKIEKAPFWGCRCMIVGAGIYSHGLSIDEAGRVLTHAQAPVPGLFATGNAVAYVEMPGGYQSGVANGRNIAYAYLAATTAATAATGLSD